MSRVRIFVDFWNFSLDMRDFDENYRLDWQRMPSILVAKATDGIASGSYEGTHVYASVDSGNPKDASLANFLSNTLDRMPGYQVKVKQRGIAKRVRCKECGTEITDCPSCNKRLKRTVEKGVDTSIVTDMLQHAWDDTYDLAILLSSDSDFIPAVEFLDRRGKKIVHASFSVLGRELASKCWKQINLRLLADSLKYK
jgi:uncharacterized LabA/DUF88 family protein